MTIGVPGRQVQASSGGVRDVNNTCNVLHVPRAAEFNSVSVLNQVMRAQQLLATGASLPPDLSASLGSDSSTSWLGGASSDVMSCVWAKDIGGVVGTISIMLKPRTRYLETIFPGDLLFVFMDDAGQYGLNAGLDGVLVTVCVVDRVAESTSVQNGATVSVVSVAARDLAVIFVESSTVFDPAFADIAEGEITEAFTGKYIGQLFGDKKQSALSPIENVAALLQILFDGSTTQSGLVDLQWKLVSSLITELTPQLLSILDVGSWMQTPIPFYALAEPPDVVQAGNAWSLLEGYSNPVVNEFFVDVRDFNPQESDFSSYLSQRGQKLVNNDDASAQNVAMQGLVDSAVFRNDGANFASDTIRPQPRFSSVPALVFRQRPYDDDAFNRLPYTLVDSTEVETLELSRTSHDVFNWFRIRFPDLDPIFQEKVAGIRIVPLSVNKFGFRRMEAQTRYPFLSSDTAITFDTSDAKSDFGDVFRAYVALLSSWYAQNDFWLSGQMTMRFKPRIRVGTRLTLQRGGKNFDFYVQGVQHSYSKDPGASRTSLTLVRGRETTRAVPVPGLFDYQSENFGGAGFVPVDPGGVGPEENPDNVFQGAG